MIRWTFHLLILPAYLCQHSRFCFPSCSFVEYLTTGCYRLWPIVGCSRRDDVIRLSPSSFTSPSPPANSRRSSYLQLLLRLTYDYDMICHVDRLIAKSHQVRWGGPFQLCGHIVRPAFSFSFSLYSAFYRTKSCRLLPSEPRSTLLQLRLLQLLWLWCDIKKTLKGHRSWFIWSLLLFV